jgi:DNA-binding MurR/RpiR family transcriptional regulator
MDQGRPDVSAAAALSGRPLDRGPLNASIVEAFDILPPQLQTAARYMLDRPDDVALLSMREQARRAGVPAATMTRLAKRLGLEGYDQVRELYAGAVRAGTLGFAGKAGVQVEAQKLRGERALASEMALRLSRQIAALAEPASLERLVDAAGRLHEARRVYCLGLRSCHAAAWHFHYMLSLLSDKTVMLDDAGGTGLDAIRDAGPADVLLAASVEPYARATIDGARYAAGQGVPVVALTDSEVSPLTQIAAATILVATDSPSFLHTMTPLLAVAEILAALVAGRGGNKALAALEHTEAQLSAFGVHLPRRGAREKA